MSADWHPEQVKAAIRMRGMTLTQLALTAGYDESAVRRTLRHRWPAVERVIAKFLGIRPQSIWPSRYDRTGNPVRAKAKRARAVRLRQNDKAA